MTDPWIGACGRSGRHLGALLLASAIVLAIVSGTGAAGDDPKRAPELRNPDYVGHVVGMPGVRVAMRIERKRRGGQRVVFQVRDEAFVCEDGIERVTGLLGSRGLSSSGHFDALYTEGPADGTNVAFDLAHGMLGERRAHGFLFTAGFNGDECWTDGKLRWRARRVDGSPRTTSHRPVRGEAPGAFKPGPPSGPPPGTNGRAGRAANSVRLRAVGDGEDRVEVRARVRLLCDGPDGIQELGLPRMVLPIRDGRFERLLYKQRRDSKRRTFTWIRGKVGAGGGATGALAHFDDPWDPEGTVNRPECHSGPLVHWRTRIR